MPIHDSGRVEYSIDSGHIVIVTDAGQRVPAYWAHPQLGKRFSAVCLLHDWWGVNTVTRLLANFLAQMGYYVVAPDLYLGDHASTPKEAMQLLQKSEANRYEMVDSALSVLETHNMTNRHVAVLGLGMGGTLAFEAAIKRPDLEAAISYAGFPQRFLGRFAQANTPILAVYGSNEPYTKPAVIRALKDELEATELHEEHRVVIIPDAGHEFFQAQPDPALRTAGKLCMNHTLEFLEQHLEKPEASSR